MLNNRCLDEENRKRLWRKRLRIVSKIFTSIFVICLCAGFFIAYPMLVFAALDMNELFYKSRIVQTIVLILILSSATSYIIKMIVDDVRFWFLR